MTPDAFITLTVGGVIAGIIGSIFFLSRNWVLKQDTQHTELVEQLREFDTNLRAEISKVDTNLRAEITAVNLRVTDEYAKQDDVRRIEDTLHRRVDTVAADLTNHRITGNGQKAGG